MFKEDDVSLSNPGKIKGNKELSPVQGGDGDRGGDEEEEEEEGEEEGFIELVVCDSSSDGGRDSDDDDDDDDDDDGDGGSCFEAEPLARGMTVSGRETIETIMDRAHDLLKRVFGFEAFRGSQAEVIQRMLTGQSSLVVQPTGSGKSLMYLLPSLMLDGMALVVSPLLSLMTDQVNHLPAALPGACLNSQMSRVETARVLCDIRERRLKVLFVSPERLFSGSFQRLLAQPGFMPQISLAVVDEAHCISQWSHNFRPSYLRLRTMLSSTAGILKPRSVLALTATSSRKTSEDIRALLQLPETAASLGCWRRDNLIISVSRETDRLAALESLLRSPLLQRGTGEGKFTPIVYVFRKRDAEGIADWLNTKGFDAGVSWGLDGDKRRSVQSRFMSGNLKLIVATVAFGMGLDKGDVGAVIHYHLPKSIENYVQEIGRAGRDGRRAYCHLMLDDEDFILNHSLCHSDGIDAPQIRSMLRSIFKNESSTGITVR